MGGTRPANHKLSGSSGFALEQIGIFRDLDLREIERLTQRVHWRNYKAHQQIICHQEASTDVYFMVSGTVRVILFSSAGKEVAFRDIHAGRSEEHTSELQSLMRISYAVFCLKKK